MARITKAFIDEPVAVVGGSAPTSISSGTYLSSATSVPSTSANTTSVPAINNRSIVPTENPGEGYEWRWVSMAYANNPYGGEWRKVAKTTGTTSATGFTSATSATGTTSTADATAKLLADQAAAATAAANQAARQSAYDLLLNEFKKYGLESLVKEVEYLIQRNVSPSEFAIALQNTQTYQQRFSANKDRIAAGLRALTPAEYIGLEDQYQNIMRNYGLPASYYTKDATGKQPGFDKFLAGDVSAAELEDRIATAQKRVLNADINVSNALKQFYPDITNGDILAYTLDPQNALENIKRKVTAAEIGGAALSQGLGTGVSRAEELAGYGVTRQQAQQGYGAIAEFLPTATKLGDIYAKQGMGAYDQATAEAETFGTAGAATAAQKRKKLTELERASFSGSSGTTQGALARERAGAF